MFGVISIPMCLVMLYRVFFQTHYPGFVHWTAAIISLCAGGTLLPFRGLAPDFLTVVVANSLVILFFLLFRRGIARFMEHDLRNGWLDYLVYGLAVCLLIISLYLSPGVQARMIIMDAAGIYYTARALWTLKLKQRISSVPLISISIVIYIALSLTRTVHTLLSSWELIDLLKAGPMQQIHIAVLIAVQLLLIMGLFAAHSSRMEQDLRRAIQEIKTLSGIIPICSFCRKIRDDLGFWKQVEVYISTHTEARFSHGICPECEEREYREMEKELG